MSNQDYSSLLKENKKLKQQLARCEYERAHLEDLKENNQIMLRKIIEETNNAKVEAIDHEKSINLSLTRLTQMLAHDVNKPYALIETFLNLLEQEHNIDKIKELSIKFIPQVRNSIISAMKLIQEFNEIGKIERLNYSLFDINKLIKSSYNECIKILNKKSISPIFKFNLTKDVKIDITKIQRVLNNIILNALQEIESDQTITFETKEIDEKYFQVSITNTGSFIPEQETKIVFDAFYTKNKKMGTGLGLAIARKIIEDHKGKIWCTSSESKNCVTFNFKIPKCNKKI